MNNPRVIVLCLSLVIAVLLEVVRVVPNSEIIGKTFDENMSTVVAMGRRFAKVPQNTAYDNQRLLEFNSYPEAVHSTVEDNSNGLVYYSILHFYLQTQDVTFTSPRAVSNFMYLLSVVVFSMIAYALFRNVGWALFAVVLFACHNQVILWACISRAYLTALLFILFSSYFLIRIIQERDWKRSWLIGYAIFSVLAFLSHYYTIILIAGGGLALFITFGWEAKWKVVKLYSGIAIVPLIWILYALSGLQFMMTVGQEASNSANSGWPTEMLDSSNKGKFIYQLYIALANQWQHWVLLAKVKARYAFMLAVLPLGMVVGYVGYAYYKKRTLDQILTVLLLLSALPVFNVALAVVKGQNVSLLPKFSIFSIPFIVLILALGCFTLYKSSSKWAKGFGVGFAAVFLVSFVAGAVVKLNKVIPEKDRYIMAADAIVAQYQPQDTLVFPTWQDANITTLYLPEEERYTFVYNYAYRDSAALFLRKKDGSMQKLIEFLPDDIRRTWD